MRRLLWRSVGHVRGVSLRRSSGAAAAKTLELVEVGRLEDPSEAPYRDGQIFIHKRLSYRGVVLFSWDAKVTDASAETPIRSSSQRYYAALLHQKDRPFIPVPFDESFQYLHSAKQTDIRMQNLSKVKGLDLLPHDEVLPLSSSVEVDHPLFPSLFSVRADPALQGFVGTSELEGWRRRLLPVCETAQVKAERTGDVVVRALFLFLGSTASPSRTTFVWRCTVRLENVGQRTLSLRSRDWKLLVLGPNKLERLPERGAVGYEPTLSPAQPVFQYSTLLSSPSSSSHLFGKFLFEDEEQQQLSVNFPTFILNAPPDHPPHDPQRPTTEPS